jgi:hypothetical protein
VAVIERNQKADEGVERSREDNEVEEAKYFVYGVGAMGVLLVAMTISKRVQASAVSMKSFKAGSPERTPTPTAASAPTSPFSSQEPMDRTPSYHEAMIDPDITVCHL